MEPRLGTTVESTSGNKENRRSGSGSRIWRSTSGSTTVRGCTVSGIRVGSYSSSELSGTKRNA